jgi:hypothetical protein
VVETLARLRSTLDASAIPPKVVDRNVLVATWNIRSLGRVTPKWSSAPGDSPKRCFADVVAIAEIVSRFDVVALQEVKRDLSGLEAILEALGPEWGWILTDLTRGGQTANQERMAFLYDTRRVRPSGLAAELVVPIETETSLSEEACSASSPGRRMRSASNRRGLRSRWWPCTSSGAAVPTTVCRRSGRSHAGWPTGHVVATPSGRI